MMCINDETYSLNETVDSVLLGTTLYTGQENFTSDISYIGAGICNTLEINEKIGSTFGSIKVFLNKTMNYAIFVHDSEFFFYSSNAKAIPGFRKILDIKDEVGLILIPNVEVIQFNKLPRNASPCEEDPNYSLKICIKKAVINYVGCRLPWAEVDQNIANCTTFEQFLKHEKFYQEIAMKEQKAVLDMTGCKVPCKYRDFKEVDTPIKKRITVSEFGISIVSTDITVKTEELLYPLSSFVSEFGGALGLFLGFSFIMVWDVAIFLFQTLRLLI